ncbi:hypothetical protein [Microvirga tunisiensis]|uniref:Uncharacterized protein n=1 Tax=Microvirga tunisiensis TaxID=2108360 RepID=A0A5N7MW45_9HYPH|nr:hypothetical protein [Microvirga tunisiensis]MPR12962.1 hypothetical protein [Microvirga tunisiensis]MPR30890.1 hypothetical protein [Microvirga tunisiensis]
MSTHAERALRAIIARIQGNFEDPDLKEFGPLSAGTLTDVLAIAGMAQQMKDPSPDIAGYSVYLTVSEYQYGPFDSMGEASAYAIREGLKEYQVRPLQAPVENPVVTL